MMDTPVLVDGIPTASVGANDRGFMYGDGLFETIAVHDGRPCLWGFHLGRLRKGVDRLCLPCPSEDLLFRECTEIIGEQRRCVVKLVLTRGAGGRGYGPPERPSPTRVFYRYGWPDHPLDWQSAGVRVEVCHTRLADQPLLAGLKHLNRLEQVLARSEWKDPGRAEGLMCDLRGRVIGGTMSNLFVLSDSATVLATPLLDRCGIRGTVRDLILKNAHRFGISAVEKDLYLSDLAEAEGLFLTNALIGVWPVRQLGEQGYDVGRLPHGFLNWIRAAVQETDPEIRNPCAPC
jgi:4-amino-4-deoxychorismate lyase